MAVGTSSGTKLIKGQTETKAIAHLTSISGISASAETIDVTALDSTGGYREYIASYKDGGEVQISGFFDYEENAGQRDIYTAFDLEAKDTYIIEYPPVIGAKWTFDAVITAFEITSETGSATGFSATLKVSGKPVLSALSDEVSG